MAGVDVEPLAVAAAETALSLFAADHGVRAVPARLAVADAVSLPVEGFPGRPDGGYDLVIGNPPFGGQLKGATRRASEERAAMKARFGTAAGAYTDRSSLFLLLALELVGEGGRVQLILPRSVLVRTRRRAGTRAPAQRGEPGRGLGGRGRIVRRRGSGVRRGGNQSGNRSHHRGLDRNGPIRRTGRRARSGNGGWGSLLAAMNGVPAVELTGPTLGTLASATAGFRQQYYGLVPFVREREEGDGMPLVTSGLIEPAELRWGRTSCRFARRRWTAPVVDHEALRAENPTVGAWSDARRRPKLLVASQTRIIEAVADPSGHLVPPRYRWCRWNPENPRDLWRVAAA